LAVPTVALAADDLQAELAQMKQALAQLQRQAARPAGKDIYEAACAPCHGTRGTGMGPAASRFLQHATDFTQGAYKLRSTPAKVLLPGDLERTIREGMPGTEMVPFRGVLSEQGIKDVAAYVRSLAPAGGDAGALEDANKRRIDGAAQRPAPVTGEGLAKSKQLFVDRCVECHGDNGEGSDKEKDDWGFRVYMNDFRLGVFKSGNRDADLFRSIAAGMNGTSMGEYSGEITPEETWGLVDYMRTLEQKPSGLIAKGYNWLFVERPSGFNYGSR
jgi:mono/diheme cytochrome c family protein